MDKIKIMEAYQTGSSELQRIEVNLPQYVIDVAKLKAEYNNRSVSNAIADIVAEWCMCHQKLIK